MPSASHLLSLDRAVVIAHRGGSKLRPENTRAAFAHAVALGADACECDVHLSRDGEVVVIHDDTLDRTTDGTGPVSARSALELERVDAGPRFTTGDGFPFRGRTGGLPRLADLLADFASIPWTIEIKGDRPELAAHVIKVIRAAGAEGRVIVGGFSQTVLDAVRATAPELVTGASRLEVQSALRRAYLRLAPREPAFQVFQVPFRFHGRQIFKRPFVRVATRAKLPVQAWIVDEAADVRQLLEWGVTGIISDRPDVALAVVGAASAVPRPQPATLRSPEEERR